MIDKYGREITKLKEDGKFIYQTILGILKHPKGIECDEDIIRILDGHQPEGYTESEITDNIPTTLEELQKEVDEIIEKFRIKNEQTADATAVIK